MRESPLFNRLLTVAYYGMVVLAVALLAVTVRAVMTTPEPALPYRQMQAAPAPDDTQATLFADGLRRLFATGELPDDFAKTHAAWLRYPLHAEMWRNGALLGESMSLGGNASRSLNQLAASFRQLRMIDAQAIRETDHLSLTFFYQPEIYDRTRHIRDLNHWLVPRHHGVFFFCQGTGMFMPNYRWRTHQYTQAAQAVDTYMAWLACDRDAVEGGYGVIVRFETLHLMQQAAGDVPQRWLDAKAPLPALESQDAIE